MKKKHVKNLKLMLAVVLIGSLTNSCQKSHSKESIQNKSHVVEIKNQNIEIEYKNSVVSYYGSREFTEKDLLINAKLIDIADRRFETKWKNKDPKGISEEYTSVGGVFMKPGTKPRLGREEIEKEFSKSVKDIDRIEFFQDELEFFGDMDVAFQRCHMLGYVNAKKEHVFEGSYIILWKKENDNWLIEYDMFNSDK